MNKLRWLILVLLLAACGGAEETTAVPATIASSAPENAAAEVLPTATAVPPQPTNTRSPTVVPPTPQPPTRPATAVPPTATIRPTSTPIPADVPALVWLPYGTGNFGQPVLMLEAEAVAPQPMPVAVEIFFDYQAGWLAYGSHFWQPTASQQSVTDLHLYNFATGEDVVWAEQVGRAAVSPQQILDGPPPVAAAVHNGQTFDLILLRGAENRTVLVEDVQPYFSWSPDGRQIAYLRNNNLFITDAVGDSGNPPIASGVYQSSGWIGDAPLWLGDSGYLLYADAPFTIVAADGSGTIVPTAVDGNTLAAGRPFAMLYSATTNQLIAESEGMFGSSVAIYQLSDDFATAELVEQFEDAQLAGWYEADVSIILSISGEPTILPLTPQE